jgi:hypothetical protein
MMMSREIKNGHQTTMIYEDHRRRRRRRSLLVVAASVDSQKPYPFTS